MESRFLPQFPIRHTGRESARMPHPSVGLLPTRLAKRKMKLAQTEFWLRSNRVCQSPRFQPPPALLKTRCLRSPSLWFNPVPESTVFGTPWLEQAAQTNRLNMRKARKYADFQ